MAGAGKRTFIAGEVLTAAQVNDYLMDQAVMRFSGSAARAASITAPTEGMVTYLDDTNRVEFYNDNRWITMIDSGVVTTKGDLFVASASATVTRVGVGTNGQFLTASSGAAAGVTWTTPAAGSLPYNAISKITATNASWPVPSLSANFKIARVTVIGGGGGGGAAGANPDGANGGAGGTTSVASPAFPTVSAAGGAGGAGRNGTSAAAQAGLASANGGGGGAEPNGINGNDGVGGVIEVRYLDLTGLSTLNVTIGAGGSAGTNTPTTKNGAAGGRGEVLVEYVTP